MTWSETPLLSLFLCWSKKQHTYLLFQESDMLARDFLLICGRTRVFQYESDSKPGETSQRCCLNMRFRLVGPAAIGMMPSCPSYTYQSVEMTHPRNRHMHSPEDFERLTHEEPATSSLTIAVCILIISVTFLLSDLLCFVLFFSLPQKFVCFVTYSPMVVPFW